MIIVKKRLFSSGYSVICPKICRYAKNLSKNWHCIIWLRIRAWKCCKSQSGKIYHTRKEHEKCHSAQTKSQHHNTLPHTTTLSIRLLQKEKSSNSCKISGSEPIWKGIICWFSEFAAAWKNRTCRITWQKGFIRALQSITGSLRSMLNGIFGLL